MERDPQELNAIRGLLHHDVGPEPDSADADLSGILLDRGFAGLAATRWPGWVEGLPPPARGALDGAYRATALRNVLLLESMERARAALAAAGIPSRPFKGAALFESGVWSDRGARTMGDVDLLVTRGDAREAMRALVASGFRRWTPPADGVLEWADAATFDDLRSDGPFAPTVDLHWRVGRGGLRFGAPGLEGALMAGSTPGPPPEVHFVHIAEHVVRHLRVLPHLYGLADLVRLAPRVKAWDDVVALAATGPLAPAVAALIVLVEEDLGALVPTWVAGEILSLSGGERVRFRLVHLLVDPRTGRVPGLRQRWRWVGGGRRAFVEYMGTALPHRRWLRARYPRTPRPLRLLHFWAHGMAWLAGASTSPASPNQRFEIPPLGRGRGRGMGHEN